MNVFSQVFRVSLIAFYFKSNISVLLLQMAGFTQPIDKRVIAHIRELAMEGHRNVPSVKLILKDFVKELAPQAPESNRRFYPTNNDIRSHIYQAVVGSK